MKEISVEYFAQCQVQMLVTGVKRCNLVSYSIGGCKIFHISRDDEWCSLALVLLQELQRQHISTRQPLTPAFYLDTVRVLHGRLLRQTIKSMRAISEQLVTEALSAFNAAAKERFWTTCQRRISGSRPQVRIFWWKESFDLWTRSRDWHD